MFKKKTKTTKNRKGKQKRERGRGKLRESCRAREQPLRGRYARRWRYYRKLPPSKEKHGVRRVDCSVRARGPDDDGSPFSSPHGSSSGLPAERLGFTTPGARV